MDIKNKNNNNANSRHQERKFTMGYPKITVPNPQDLFYLRVKINDFGIAIKGLGQFDHGESENCGFETLGSNFRPPGPKNLRVITRSNMLLIN